MYGVYNTVVLGGDCSFPEDGGFRRALRLRVEVLERQQERMIGIAGEGAEILFGRNRSEAV